MPLAFGKVLPVIWQGQQVGTFEYLAMNADGLVFGFWTAATSPQTAAFVVEVQQGREPQAQLTRLADAVTFTVLRIEPGRRWRGPEVSRIELMVLAPGMEEPTA
jgi:hypothetical protein